jgi:transcriptional regulator with XRE-family HTH domain
MISRAPHPLDIHIGNRLRLRRKMVGLSQDGLGKLIGVTFQQIQKYERGTNSINAHRLYDIAIALGVVPAFFYEGYGSEAQPIHTDHVSTQGMQLIRDYCDIPSAKVRQSFAALLHAVAKEQPHGL